MSSIDLGNLAKPPKYLSHCIRNFSENPAIVFNKMYRGVSKTFLFESGAPGGVNGNLSILGSFGELSVRIFEDFAEIERDGQVLRSKMSSRETLEALIKNTFSKRSENEPLYGGVIGYLGYDSLVFFEEVFLKKEKQRDIPLTYLGITDEFLVIDHSKNQLEIFVSVFNEKEELKRSHRIEEIKRAIAGTGSDGSGERFSAGQLKSSVSPEAFVSMVKRAKEYISEGDIFQANLSQQFSAEFAGSAWDLYLNLKKINPSPFQGYINFGDVEVVSGSPERLVKVSSGRIETRPIAGTRRRGREPEDDKRLSEELILNEKERAEHLMLVDLERNDLGRVCKYGSVQVEEFMSLEAYSHVWHIVSGVAGSLKEGTTPMDILEACFPGGTITGCPKVRCMEIIEELEPVSRGVYTGSMGYFGWGGNIDLNILIRSAVIANGEIRFSTGAGIVADSDPASEHKETLSKAKAMMEALGSANVCY